MYLINIYSNLMILVVEKLQIFDGYDENSQKSAAYPRITGTLATSAYSVSLAKKGRCYNLCSWAILFIDKT